MKKTRKMLTLLLAFVLLQAIIMPLSGVIKAEEEPVTLRFMNWQTNHSEANQRIFDAFEEKYPNIKLEVEYVGDMSSQDYLQKVDIMVMGNESLDIVMTPSYIDYASRAASGSYMDLGPFFEAEGTSIDELYNAQMAIDGKYYGIASDLKYEMVLINKDMLDEAGLEVPPLDWTWEDFADYAEKLTHGEGPNKVYGAYFHNWSSTMSLGLQTKFEGNLLFESETDLRIDDPSYAKWFEYVYDLENNKQVATPLMDIKSLNMNYRDQFFNGKIAMLPMASYMIPEIGNEKYPHDFVTTFAPIPVWDDGTPGLTNSAPLVYSISKTASHPEEAFTFLRFLTTEGVRIKKMFISSEAGTDRMDFVEPMIEDFPELVDAEALSNVLNNPDLKANVAEFIPTYQKEVDTVLYEELEMYLLGDQDLETTIENMLANGQLIIDKEQ